ncbi:MAG: sensor histidine kinase, partial [Crocinitomicaceae bacterium]|nr:sensor histidine kinase [Crocinitomicaceae bacterium]
MRNLKPVHILLGGSAIIGALTFVLFIILHNVWDALELWMVFIIPFIIAFISFWSFYYFVKVFITEKLRILYRSIRKGKFDTTTDTSINVLDDVIERAEIETTKWTDERNAEISKLKEQEEFRREFLGNLAHELKTPVFSIQGYILTLLEGGLEDENVNRSFLERASKATERMTDILEDLDQITRMEVDKIILDITHFDIKELVDDVFEELEIKARKKHIEL